MTEKKTIRQLAKSALKQGITSSLVDAALLTDEQFMEVDINSLSQLDQINFKLLDVAKQGDVQAIKAVHDRLFGKPFESVRITTTEVPYEDISDDDLINAAK